MVAYIETLKEIKRVEFGGVVFYGANKFLNVPNHGYGIGIVIPQELPTMLQDGLKEAFADAYHVIYGSHVMSEIRDEGSRFHQDWDNPIGSEKDVTVLEEFQGTNLPKRYFPKGKTLMVVPAPAPSFSLTSKFASALEKLLDEGIPNSDVSTN